MACMIPFDMARLDSNAVSAAGVKKEPVMDRIINIAKVMSHTQSMRCLQGT